MKDHAPGQRAGPFERDPILPLAADKLGDSLILVKVVARPALRPDFDDEWVDGLLGNPTVSLHPRDYCAAQNIDREGVKRDVEAEVFWTPEELSRPIVEPDSPGEINVPLSSRIDDRGKKKPRT